MQDNWNFKSQAGSEALSEPVCKLGLSELGEIIDTLFTEVDAADLDILSGCFAHALDDDSGIGLEDNAVVDDLVNGEGDKVVVLDNGALVNGLPSIGLAQGCPIAGQIVPVGAGSILEEEVKRVTERKDSVVEQNLVLVDVADNVHHNVGLVLVQNNAVIVEDDVAILLRGLVDQALLESLLRLQVGVRTA
jgi:hypothetical protein